MCGPGQFSRYSDSLQAGYAGIESWLERNFPHPPRQALGPTQPPMQWVPGVLRIITAKEWR
jgi:hypothetical protein